LSYISTSPSSRKEKVAKIITKIYPSSNCISQYPTEVNKMTEREVFDSTKKHIDNVRFLIFNILEELTKRASRHDESKLLPPEFQTFVEFTPKLADSTYGSEEYKQFLKEMKPALDHHYAKNRHHPEHFKEGVRGMNLVDLMEMLADWYSATMRHNDGDIMKSIEYNQTRFQMSDDLTQILKNSVVDLFNLKK
jgi:hypothetical protein